MLKRGNLPFCCVNHRLGNSEYIHFLFFRNGKVQLALEDRDGRISRLGVLSPYACLDTLDECLDYLHGIGYRKLSIVYNPIDRYRDLLKTICELSIR